MYSTSTRTRALPFVLAMICAGGACDSSQKVDANNSNGGAIPKPDIQFFSNANAEWRKKDDGSYETMFIAPPNVNRTMQVEFTNSALRGLYSNWSLGRSPGTNGVYFSGESCESVTFDTGTVDKCWVSVEFPGNRSEARVLTTPDVKSGHTPSYVQLWGTNLTMAWFRSAMAAEAQWVSYEPIAAKVGITVVRDDMSAMSDPSVTPSQLGVIVDRIDNIYSDALISWIPTAKHQSIPYENYPSDGFLEIDISQDGWTTEQKVADPSEAMAVVLGLEVNNLIVPDVVNGSSITRSANVVIVREIRSIAAVAQNAAVNSTQVHVKSSNGAVCQEARISSFRFGPVNSPTGSGTKYSVLDCVPQAGKSVLTLNQPLATSLDINTDFMISDTAVGQTDLVTTTKGTYAISWVTTSEALLLSDNVPATIGNISAHEMGHGCGLADVNNVTNVMHWRPMPPGNTSAVRRLGLFPIKTVNTGTDTPTGLSQEQVKLCHEQMKTARTP